MKRIILFLTVFLVLYLGIRVFAPKYEDEFILDGYNDEFVLDTGAGMDFSTYSKYYYDKTMDQKFIDSGWYHKVEEENIEYLSEYFDDIKKSFEYLGMDDDYDFDNSTITVGDYFLIKTEEGTKIGDHEYGRFDIYRIYLYDMEEHILYRIHEKG